MEGSGRTALVTGASAGIGAAFAEVLAERGFELVLVARRRDRLEQLAETLRARGCKAHVFPADLADPTAPQRLFDELCDAGIAIDVLVNNAGYGILEPFGKTAWKEQADFLQVLVTSLAHLCHLFIPGMVDRGYGRVVNLASLAAFSPEVPGNLYGGAKSFVVRMSRSLALELASTNVHVTAVCPGFTHSEFHDVLGNREGVSQLPSFMWMDAKTVAQQAYEAVMRGRSVYVNGRVNWLIAAVCNLLPGSLVDALARPVAKLRRND